jgi:predicted type IV restriction endonuclease
MGLFDELKLLSEQIRKRQTQIKGEEATKQALILPFLAVMGYDVYDPTEVLPEYHADFAQKGVKEKVDYLLSLKGVPSIFIEAKAVGAVCEDHSGQLARYFNATPTVKLGVITNGTLYQFFTEAEPNMMAAVPFFVFNTLDFSERDVDTLRLFSKDSYDPAALRGAAEDIIYVGKLTSLVGDLLRSPSEAFVRFLLGEVDVTAGKRLTSKVVERFIPTVRKAIQTNLLEMATRSIRLETSEAPQLALVSPITAALEFVPIVNEKDARIVTTAEELEAFEIVKKWVAESAQAAKFPIVYKDSLNYLAIHLQVSSLAWFLRLQFDSKKKGVATRLPVETVKMLAPGFEVEAFVTSTSVSRLFVTTVKDLEKLRTLVMFAYEDAVKKRESSKDGEGSASA